MLDENMEKEKFLELQTQVHDMSALNTLDIYLGGLEPTVRMHLLGSQHVGTLERALEESRIFANAHLAMVCGILDGRTILTILWI